MRSSPTQIYTFIDNAGVNTHIDSENLRLWCLKTPKLELFNIPIQTAVAVEMVHINVISLDRFLELRRRKHQREHFDPIIMVKDGTIGSNGRPNVMLVDGHHRYFIAASDNEPYIEGWILEVAQWKPFQIKSQINLTQQQLIDLPPTKRNY